MYFTALPAYFRNGQFIDLGIFVENKHCDDLKFFLRCHCMKAQEAAEEQEVMKVNEAVLRGEEALAETEVPLRVVGRMDS